MDGVFILLTGWPPKYPDGYEDSCRDPALSGHLQTSGLELTAPLECAVPVRPNPATLAPSISEELRPTVLALDDVSLLIAAL